MPTICVRHVLAAFALSIGSQWLALPNALAADVYVVKPVAEKRLVALPPGPLYWRVERMPTLADAQAAAADRWNADTVKFDPVPALAAEVAGAAWLCTLGPKGASTPGAQKLAEIGPVPAIDAPDILLRLNQGSGPPGSRTPVHMHPGSEAFYVVSGQLSQRTMGSVATVKAGESLNGHAPGMAMEVFNSGDAELTALIMFVVDASKPFSTPTTMQ